MYVAWPVSIVLALVLTGCATTSEKLSQRGLEAITTLQGLPASARPRVVVAPVLNRTTDDGAEEFSAAMIEVGGEEAGRAWLAGVHDLLLTGLLNTGAFTVLERSGLEELESERLFAAKTGDAVLESGRLEGADLLLVPAITGFEPSGGGVLPLPIPISKNGDFAVLWLRAGSASISMDMRLVDIATGRVLQSTAVRGKAREFRADLDLFFFFKDGYAALPGVLGYYNNTPLHAAILKMVGLAVDRIGLAVAPRLENISDPKTAALFAVPKNKPPVATPAPTQTPASAADAPAVTPAAEPAAEAIEPGD